MCESVAIQYGYMQNHLDFFLNIKLCLFWGEQQQQQKSARMQRCDVVQKLFV